MCDKVDSLDQQSIEDIGRKGKELGKEFDILIQRLFNTKEVDYDKNQIDFL